MNGGEDREAPRLGNIWGSYRDTVWDALIRLRLRAVADAAGGVISSDLAESRHSGPRVGHSLVGAKVAKSSMICLASWDLERLGMRVERSVRGCGRTYGGCIIKSVQDSRRVKLNASAMSTSGHRYTSASIGVKRMQRMRT